ncbi:MAG: ABC transporter permease [Candidatus Aminicenantes bacterium]|nr:MAG: ABC transporter permease [Candidatus Aminicenantes bacterium]
MLKNYLKIALRNIKKHKGYSLINVTGLAIGIAVCLFILLWVQDELSFDRFHANIDNLYRLTEDQIYTDGTIFPVAVTPELLGPGLKTDYPEVVEFARFRILGRVLVSTGDKDFYENGFACADPAFFQMFTFPLLKGSPAAVLSDMGKVVISEEIADKYFGSENPIGKPISLNKNWDFLVSGVMKNIPVNSHMRLDFVAHFDFLIKELGYGGGWWNNNFYTYVRLAEKADVEKLSKEVYGYLKKIYDKTSTRIRLQPVKDIHLRSHYAIDLYGATQDKSQYVYIFTAVAFIVLLLACINFMNLATARSGVRSREVGLRKVVGARRFELILQFFGESVLFALMASLIASVLVLAFLPVFNSLTAKSLPLSLIFSPAVILFLVGISLFTGIFSGVYPALFLSAFQPVSIFRGDSLTGTRSAFFRKALVVLQFALSIVFIAGTLIIGSQLRYIQSRNLGFDKEAVMHFRLRGSLRQKYEAFKTELLQLSGIENVTRASNFPTYTVHSTSAFRWEGMTPEDKILVHHNAVGYDYIKTFEIEIVDGRDFSKQFPSDKDAFIVNETAVRLMRYEEPVGKRIQLWNLKGAIIGVVKDFHYKSLHTEIEPLLLRIAPGRNRYVFVKLRTENIHDNIQALGRIYSKHCPEYPFEFGFLDESLDNLYRNDRRVGSVFNVFTVLAIFISCLGLFGLASFLIERRTKEIGIRKILGADVGKILVLLSRDFLRWVAVANIIAWPVAFFAMNRWLQNFAYRTNIALWTFALAAGFALGIALLTISYHSIRASLSNPADSLRYE